LVLAGAGVLAVAVFAGLARQVDSPAPALAEIERLIELAGLGLSQVSVSGHRYTPDADVFDAVGLAAAPTMLSFDTRHARRRIESLPWVERASVERVVPDRIEVRIIERTPYAVWRLGSSEFLIDKVGRALGTAPKGAATQQLPRVAGEGAATEARRLFELLAGEPVLARQVALAERVGGRRWTLHLTAGGRILLPAEGEAEALLRALQIARAQGRWDGEIDLRVAHRPLVRAPQREPDGSPREAVVTGGT
jgi:cell division protein FtsQ